MEHNQRTHVKPTNVSSSGFRVKLENQFVVLDIAEHVFGVNVLISSLLILENIQNGLNLQFIERNSILNEFFSLVYDEEDMSLYSGDRFGHLVQHKVDTLNQTCKEVKNYGDLEIGSICSSHRFINFVFFGGDDSRIKVLDLSTGEFLPGYIQTSIKEILSLQVCVKSPKQIYLAVSGEHSDYSEDKTDLFNLSGFLKNDPVIQRKFVFEYPNFITFFTQKSSIKSHKDKIRKLTEERDEYKAKFTQMQSKYNDLKEKYDKVLKKKDKLTEAFNALKIVPNLKTRNFVKKLNILYNHKSTRTTIGDYNPVNRNRLFDETDPLIIIRDLKEDLKQEKDQNRQLQNGIYHAVDQRREAEEETRRLRTELDTLGNNLDTIKGVVRQR